MKKLLLTYLLFIGTLISAQVTLGSGTTSGGVSTSVATVPWSTYYGYSYTQQILTKTDINADAAGSITGLKFYLGASQVITNSNEVVVYVGLTNKTNFSSATDWIPTTSLTQVFSGVATNNAGVVEITFSTPFAYDNVNNLVIAVDENKSGDDGGEHFYTYSNGSNKTLYYRSDSTNPNPVSITQTGTRSATQSVVTLLGLTPSPIPSCPSVTSPSAAATGVSVTPTITWGTIGNATGYRLSVGTTAGGTDIINSQDLGNVTSFVFSTSLEYNKQYFYTVTAYNGTIPSVNCVERSFTTVNIPCPTVSAPIANATDVPLSPSITWAAINGATGYKIKVGTTTGGTDIVNNQDVGNVLTYSFATPLNSSTKYYYTVTSYNATTSSTSCTERNFTTICTAITAPYAENFDTTAVGSSTNTNAPTCWRYLEPSGWAGYGYVSTTAFTSAPNGYYIYSDAASTGGGMLVSPQTTNLTNGNNRVRFSANAGGSSYTMEVGTLSDPTDASTFVAIGSPINLTTTLTQYTVNIPAGTNQYLALRHAGGGTYRSVRFDDISIEPIPTCLEPTAVVASAITSNSATLAWTAPATAPASGYNIYYSTTNTAPTATTTPTLSVTATTTPLSPLTPATTYYVWVRSNCGSSQSPWTTIVTFTTLALPPANDNCTAPTSITPGAAFAQNPVTGTTIGATLTSDTTATTACQTTRFADTWYSVVVPASGNITIETKSVVGSSVTDTVLGVYTGSCGTLTSVGCDDDSSTDGNFSLLNLTAANGITPGQTLLIGVWNYSSANNGTFQISAYDASLSTSEAGQIKNNLTAYPNPFADVLNISDVKNLKSVSVVDIAGRLVKTIEKPGSSLQLGELKSGMYVVILNMNDGSKQTIKAIKK
ncbi:MAG: hypothetical protein K0R77_612 [Chryseobacterium sp.]|uniref:fibronectin type III domain-containing protein n=1 Tax=Chryseobacterium sp. TaxID=1871047 RepID=UPI002607E1EA|nr:fibronectin type III domain-containing protein [Chryseobacterium sp.]MDF2551337.1 hypothetical protein [Chryseobacterium sp.]